MAAFSMVVIVVARVAPISSLPTSQSIVGSLRNPTIPNQSLNTNIGELNSLTNIDYFIAENCGDRTFDIHERVDQIKMLAQPALADARLYGVDSDFGFRAIFKTDEAQESVMAILDHIYYLRGKAKLRPRPDTISNPRISCVTEDSAILYDYLNLGYDPWHRCLVGGSRSTPIQAFYAEGTIYTFLCPAFFVQPPISKGIHCPSVTNNRFSGDAGIFYRNYQTYILLYQLLRFYLGENALTSHTDPKEQLDWNDCVRLNTLNSVLNPTNFQIYIALVSQECTSWPNPFSPPFYLSDTMSSNLTLIGSIPLYTPSNTLFQQISIQTQSSANIQDLPSHSSGMLLLPVNLSISDATVAES